MLNKWEAGEVLAHYISALFVWYFFFNLGFFQIALYFNSPEKIAMIIIIFYTRKAWSLE